MFPRLGARERGAPADRRLTFLRLLVIVVVVGMVAAVIIPVFLV